MREDMNTFCIRILARLEIKRIETKRTSRRSVNASRNHKKIISKLVHRREGTIFRLSRFNNEERNPWFLFFLWPQLFQEMVHGVRLA